MEIKIYTDRKKFNANETIIDNDGFFNVRVPSTEFEKIDLEVLKNIDNAEILDLNIGTIKTPRGVCTIENLSTGCKTVLNYLYICRHPELNIKALCASYSGANAIKVLFDTMEEKNKQIDIILEHTHDVQNCGDRDYLINNKKRVKNLLWM